MQLTTPSFRARISAPAARFDRRRYVSYGLAVLIPALGLVGAARADAPVPSGGFVPIEVSADIDAQIADPAAADTVPALEQNAADIADGADEIVEDLGIGGASYYGPNLKGNRTASGERFDPTDLTAAHRTLPMGSKVKVTHNGKSVVVRINDRGPFHGNRVIDLSTAAARQIGLVGAGHGQVHLQLVSG